MKKIMTIGLILGMAMMLFAGCGGTASKTPTPSPSSAPSATAAPTAGQNTQTPTTPNNGGITADKAKDIALQDAGIVEADTWEMKVEQGTEKGRNVYEVSFTADKKEYDYDIDASSGEIVKKDIEMDH